MSRLITNSIRSTSASADAITFDGSGNATFPANVTCSGTATGMGGGKVKQFKQVKANGNTSSTSSTSYQHYSPLDLSITPTSATNLIVMQLCVLYSVGHGSLSSARGRIAISLDSGSSYLQESWLYPYRYDTGGIYLSIPMMMYYAVVAGNTNAKDFKVYHKCGDGTSSTINTNNTQDDSYMFLWEIEP